MTKSKALIAYVALGLALITLAGCTQPPAEVEQAVQVGLKAPAFTLPDLSGQQVTLDQFKGKVVMLEFWATWCGPCRMTMPLMESIQKEFGDNLILLTINLQEPMDVVRDYVRAENVHSRVLLDEEGSVGLLYGTDSIPLQILIDKQGIVRFIQAGFGPGTPSQLRGEIKRLIAG
ncbi:MAG: redoxin domain-containing protein [Acidobacteria bacterium]|nr:redoxin domain-containing protein [Acidobacteriota bacterium]